MRRLGLITTAVVLGVCDLLVMGSIKIPVRRANTRRGIALVYLSVVLLVLTAFCSLAVDLGRVQVAKGELRLAADAAARHGASGLASSPAVARANAVSAAADNRADGTTVGVDAALDVQLGTWDANTRTFTALPVAAEAGADAV